MKFEAPKVPFAVFRPDPAKLNPEDFVDGELDHGDGGWGFKFADDDEPDTDEQPEEGDDDGDWLAGALNDE